MFKSIKRALLLAVFSMFFNGEFFAYGLFLFIQPLLLLFYLPYVIILDIIIALFALTDRQIFYIGATYGMLIEGFFHRSFYSVPPLLFGVNWLVVFVQIIAWGLLATTMTFYFTGPILPRREFISRRREFIILSITTLFLILILITWGANIGPLNEPGAGLIFILIILFITLFIRSVRRPSNYPFIKDGRSLRMILKIYLIAQLIVGIVLPPSSELTSIFYAITLMFMGPFIYFRKLRKHQIAI